MSNTEQHIKDFNVTAASWVEEVDNILPTQEREIELTEHLRKGIEAIEGQTTENAKLNGIMALLPPMGELLELQKLDITPDTLKLKELKSFVEGMKKCEAGMP